MSVPCIGTPPLPTGCISSRARSPWRMTVARRLGDRPTADRVDTGCSGLAPAFDLESGPGALPYRSGASVDKRIIVTALPTVSEQRRQALRGRRHVASIARTNTRGAQSNVLALRTGTAVTARRVSVRLTRRSPRPSPNWWPRRARPRRVRRRRRPPRTNRRQWDLHFGINAKGTVLVNQAASPA